MVATWAERRRTERRGLWWLRCAVGEHANRGYPKRALGAGAWEAAGWSERIVKERLREAR